MVVCTLYMLCLQCTAPSSVFSTVQYTIAHILTFRCESTTLLLSSRHYYTTFLIKIYCKLNSHRIFNKLKQKCSFSFTDSKINEKVLPPVRLELTAFRL